MSYRFSKKWQISNARCDVHRINEAKSLLHAAFAHEFLDGISDVDEPAAIRNLKPQMLSERFHHHVA